MYVISLMMAQKVSKHVEGSVVCKGNVIIFIFSRFHRYIKEILPLLKYYAVRLDNYRRFGRTHLSYLLGLLNPRNVGS